MDRALRKALEQFALEHGFDDLESIRMALSLTRHAKRLGLPISEGEIAALEHEALCSHSTRATASAWNFALRMSASLAIREAVRSLVAQALRRAGAAGKSLVGALLYHLAGATLDCVLGTGPIEHSAFGTADPSGTRIGDYLLDDVAIHVTSSPSEALIKRCGQDLSNGIRPIVITLARHLPAAEVLAEISECMNAWSFSTSSNLSPSALMGCRALAPAPAPWRSKAFSPATTKSSPK